MISKEQTIKSSPAKLFLKDVKEELNKWEKSYIDGLEALRLLGRQYSLN